MLINALTSDPPFLWWHFGHISSFSLFSLLLDSLVGVSDWDFLICWLQASSSSCFLEFLSDLCGTSSSFLTDFLFFWKYWQGQPSQSSTTPYQSHKDSHNLEPLKRHFWKETWNQLLLVMTNTTLQKLQEPSQEPPVLHNSISKS